jgi:hypothetical protein
MEKYGFMPGTHRESHENPPVRSKFDKSQGKGLPAPHLKHPGDVAKETGSRYPGHTQNGHKLPVSRGTSMGAHLREHFSPGEMYAPMITGDGMGREKNTRLTDGNVVKSSHRVDEGALKAGHEPDHTRKDADKHVMQHDTRHANNQMGGGTDKRMGASRPQKMEDSSTRRKSDAGALAGDTGPRKHYYGGKGRI